MCKKQFFRGICAAFGIALLTAGCEQKAPGDNAQDSVVDEIITEYFGSEQTEESTEIQPESSTQESEQTSESSEEEGPENGDIEGQVPGQEDPEQSHIGEVMPYDPLEIQVVEEYTRHMMEGFSVYAQTQYVTLPEQCAARYPRLYEILGNEKQAQIEQVHSDLEKLHEAASLMVTENLEWKSDVYSRNSVFVSRADDSILSIEKSFEDDYGGAHGTHGSLGYNYDPVTGEALQLSSVCKDLNKLSDLVWAELIQKYAQYEELLEKENARGMILDQTVNWTMDYFGIELYFNLYEIAPYAAGTQRIFIPFAKYPELFEARYTILPEKCVVPLLPGQGYEVDLNRDGNSVPVGVYYSEQDISEDGEQERFNVKVGDQSLDVIRWHYDCENYLVKMGGFYYIYVYLKCENDLGFIYVFALDEEGAEEIQCIQGDPLVNTWTIADTAGENSEDYWFGRSWSQFTNPEELNLTSKIDCCSTMFAAKLYQVHSDGILGSSDPWYTVRPNGPALTLLQTISFVTVDENGNKTGSVNKDMGEVVTIYRTDNETFLDFILSDGNIGRVYLTFTEDSWQPYVNGKDPFQIFEGMFFAG